MDLAAEPGGDGPADPGRPRARAWRPGVLAAAVALCLGTLGLGVAASGGSPAFGTSPGATAPANDSADAGFTRDMAAHHQQAIDLSFIVDRTDGPEVRQWPST
jgi:hypothetical protein